MNDNYNIIFGLSEINRNYLNNIQNNKIKRISTLIIEKDPKKPNYIVTVHGSGYRFGEGK